MSRRRISDQIRRKIIVLVKQGVAKKQISKQLKCSVQFIYKLLESEKIRTIIDLHKMGLEVHEISKREHVSENAVHRYIEKYEKKVDLVVQQNVATTSTAQCDDANPDAGSCKCTAVKSCYCMHQQEQVIDLRNCKIELQNRIVNMETYNKRLKSRYRNLQQKLTYFKKEWRKMTIKINDQSDECTELKHDNANLTLLKEKTTSDLQMCNEKLANCEEKNRKMAASIDDLQAQLAYFQQDSNHLRMYQGALDMFRKQGGSEYVYELDDIRVNLKMFTGDPKAKLIHEKLDQSNDSKNLKKIYGELDSRGGRSEEMDMIEKALNIFKMTCCNRYEFNMNNVKIRLEAEVTGYNADKEKDCSDPKMQQVKINHVVAKVESDVEREELVLYRPTTFQLY